MRQGLDNASHVLALVVYPVVPSPLPVWKRTDEWRPASPGGGSQGFSVKCPATGEFGHCKPISYAQEVLASALANQVGVPVPPTRLGNCEDKTVAVSTAFGAQSIDVRALKVTSPQDYSSDAFKAAVRAAAGLMAFHAWVGVGDHKDEHVVVRSPAPDKYEVASIDFADAFSFDGAGGNVGISGPEVLLAADHRDPALLLQTIDRIAALPEARIQELVSALPDDVLAPADKTRIAQGLIARKTRIKAAFQGAGWLP
jgi:hypothetical protein